jgi:hypothetical protein
MMRSTGNFSPEWGYLAPAPSFLRTLRIVLVATAIGGTAGAGVVLSLVDRSSGESQTAAAATHAIVTSVQATPAEAAPVASVAPAAAIAAPAVADAKVTPASVVTPASLTAPQAAPALQPGAQSPVQAPPQSQTAPIQAAAPQATAAIAQPDTAAQSAAPRAPLPQASGPEAASTSDASATSAQPAVAALSDAPVAPPSLAPAGTSDVTTDDQAVVGPQRPAQQKKIRHHTKSANGDDFPNIGSALEHLFSARGGTHYSNRGLRAGPNRSNLGAAVD